VRLDPHGGAFGHDDHQLPDPDPGSKVERDLDRIEVEIGQVERQRADATLVLPFDEHAHRMHPPIPHPATERDVDRRPEHEQDREDIPAKMSPT
jgi:hypothetical protein